MEIFVQLTDDENKNTTTTKRIFNMYSLIINVF